MCGVPNAHTFIRESWRESTTATDERCKQNMQIFPKRKRRYRIHISHHMREFTGKWRRLSRRRRWKRWEMGVKPNNNQYASCCATRSNAIWGWVHALRTGRAAIEASMKQNTHNCCWQRLENARMLSHSFLALADVDQRGRRFLSSWFCSFFFLIYCFRIVMPLWSCIKRCISSWVANFVSRANFQPFAMTFTWHCLSLLYWNSTRIAFSLTLCVCVLWH